MLVCCCCNYDQPAHLLRGRRTTIANDDPSTSDITTTKKERILQGYHHAFSGWDHLPAYTAIQHDVDGEEEDEEELEIDDESTTTSSSGRADEDGSSVEDLVEPPPCKCPDPSLISEYFPDPIQCIRPCDDGVPCRYLKGDPDQGVPPRSFCDTSNNHLNDPEFCSIGSEACEHDNTTPYVIVDTIGLSERGELIYADDEETEVISVTDKSYLHTTSTTRGEEDDDP
mmetsp:Transcript_30932/g.45859  ORF Transcript_30932/g.45859 Transcript_30932/m.45859 type:complete len:227 (-) Transcript_30932:337-1017(-)